MVILDFGFIFKNYGIQNIRLAGASTDQSGKSFTVSTGEGKGDLKAFLAPGWMANSLGTVLLN